VHVCRKKSASNHTRMGPVKEAKLTTSDGVKVGWGRLGWGRGVRVPRWGDRMRAGALGKATGRKQGKALPSGMGDDKVSIMRRQATAAASNHNHLPVTIT